MFKKEDLKCCYLAKLRNGLLMMVSQCENGIVLVNEDEKWGALFEYNNDMTHRTFHKLDIIEVYGFTKYANCSLEFDISDRDMLWKREEEKKIQLSQYEIDTLHYLKDHGYKYIARDLSNNDLYAFEVKPSKLNIGWNNIPFVKLIKVYNDLFEFITWNDEDPTSIEELLNNCEVQDE